MRSNKKVKKTPTVNLTHTFYSPRQRSTDRQQIDYDLNHRSAGEITDNTGKT